MSLAPFVWYERWLRFNAARSEHLSALLKAISIGTLCVGAWKESLLFSGEGEDSGYIPGARVSRGCWSAVKYTPFSNRETRVCWSAHTPSTSICVIEIADLYKCACSAVLFSCLKLGQQKLQNITQRCWKGINTSSEAPSISLMPDRRVGWFSWGPPRFLISSITSSESPLEWKDLLRWARRPEGDGPEVPAGGSGPPDQ